MKTKFIPFFILVLIATKAAAQTPGFRFGPRIGLGSARFTGIKGMSAGFSGQLQFVASKQLTSYFAIQFCPTTAMYTSQRMMQMHDWMATGRSQAFTYRDKYQVYAVEFPLLMKFSKSAGPALINVFTGPSFGCPMGGSHSKIFEDETYNSKYGFVGHELDGLKENVYSGVFGVGIDYPVGNSILGLDFRLTHAFTRFGNIEGENFAAQSATIGFTWLHL
jgi:hypothetical protein